MQKSDKNTVSAHAARGDARGERRPLGPLGALAPDSKVMLNTQASWWPEAEITPLRAPTSNTQKQRSLDTIGPQCKPTTNVLIVNDLPLMRDALQKLLQSSATGARAVAVDSIEAAAACVHHAFDLVLLDLNLPGYRNMDCLLQMRAQRPDVPVVVLALQDDCQTVLSAIDGGAMGFISKRFTGNEIADAVEIVLSGGVFVPLIAPKITAKQPHEFARRADDLPAGQSPESQRRRASDHDASQPPDQPRAPAEAPPPPPPPLDITSRQSQVLSLLIKGLCNKSICRQLSLSENTVKSHIAAIFRALGVHNRTTAVIEMSRKGYQLHRPAR